MLFNLKYFSHISDVSFAASLVLLPFPCGPLSRATKWFGRNGPQRNEMDRRGVGARLMTPAKGTNFWFVSNFKFIVLFLLIYVCLALFISSRIRQNISNWVVWWVMRISSHSQKLMTLFHLICERWKNNQCKFQRYAIPTICRAKQPFVSHSLININYIVIRKLRALWLVDNHAHA